VSQGAARRPKGWLNTAARELALPRERSGGPGSSVVAEGPAWHGGWKANAAGSRRAGWARRLGGWARWLEGRRGQQWGTAAGGAVRPVAGCGFYILVDLVSLPASVLPNHRTEINEGFLSRF
jgi:hypothetical protein